MEMFFLFSVEAEVGLEMTLYTVPEEMGVAEVCVVVTSPVLPCPIEFPFTVILSTNDGTAGQCVLSKHYV